MRPSLLERYRQLTEATSTGFVTPRIVSDRRLSVATVPTSASVLPDARISPPAASAPIRAATCTPIPL
jgi:hypothetical protein